MSNPNSFAHVSDKQAFGGNPFEPETVGFVDDAKSFASRHMHSVHKQMHNASDYLHKTGSKFASKAHELTTQWKHIADGATAESNGAK